MIKIISLEVKEMDKPSKLQVVVIILVALLFIGVGRLIYGEIEGYQIYEGTLTIKEAIRKTAGGETRTVEYFLFTDKGYFSVGGPVDADGTPYAWKNAGNLTGQLVRVRYFGEGLYHIEAWGRYLTIYEVHPIG